MLHKLFGFGCFDFVCLFVFLVWVLLCVVLLLCGGFLFCFLFFKPYYLFYLVCYAYFHANGRQLIEVTVQTSEERILSRIKSCILVPKNIRSSSVSLQLLFKDGSASLESSDHSWHVGFFLARAYEQFLLEILWKDSKPSVYSFMKMMLLLYLRILKSLLYMLVLIPHFRKQIMLRCTGYL